MTKITFEGKIRQSGEVSILTIPSQYIKDGMLWSGTKFRITIDTLEGE